MAPQKGAGFVCLDQVAGLIYYPVYRSVTIVKGDALQMESTGFAQLAAAGITAIEFLGVAASDANNGSGSDGDINVAIIPPQRGYRFYAPVGTGTAAATDRGEVHDITDEDAVNVDSSITVGWGLHIDEVDTTNNYVYGTWRLIAAS